MSRGRRSCIGVGALLMLNAGCDRQQPGPRAVSARADSARFAIVTGAQIDTMPFYLVRSPRGFPAAFSTYVPVDMVAEPLPDTSNGSIRFRMRGATNSEFEPFVHVFFFTRGTTRDNAQTQLESFVASRGVPVSEREDAAAPFSEEGIPPEAATPVEDRFAWALWESPYAYQCAGGPADACLLGRAALGQHEDRFYQVIIQYPQRAAAAFRPRAERILAEWRWETER